MNRDGSQHLRSILADSRPFAWLAAAFCLATLPLTAGCGDSDSLGRLPVSGNVTFGGAPLDHGTIDFRPVDPSAPVGSGGVIADGQYEIDAEHGLPPGKYQVRIFSSQSEGTAPPAGEAPGPGSSAPAVERIPPAYNVRTEQTVEVTAAGPNKFDFTIPEGM